MVKWGLELQTDSVGSPTYETAVFFSISRVPYQKFFILVHAHLAK